MESQDERHTEENVHGYIYQLKLLILFLHGGIENKYSFILGTEIGEAEKFDDLMFQYIHENKKVVRLLQAKHKKSGKKQITAHALLSEADHDYSLTKYFFSFEELKKNKLFSESLIKDIIICTNADFDMSDLQRANVSIQPIMDKDEILDIVYTVTGKNPMRYKFCKTIASLLKPKLENYHLTKLARRVAQCIIKGNCMQHHQRTDIFHIYHLILAKDVINTKDKKFHSKFINNKNLSPTTKRFRDLLESEFKRKVKLHLENINEELANPSDVNNEIKLVLSRNFGKGHTADQEWPQTLISDNKIDDFLNHLVFAVNQPNEEELGDILKRKIGKGFNYITTQYLYDKVFHSMLDLLQGKRKKRFLTYVVAEELLEIGRKEIFSYPAFQYEDELRLASFDRNLQFNGRDEVKNFLCSDKNIWNVYSDAPWLSSLVVYQELSRSIKIFRYLFLPWSYLQDSPNIISDFKEVELMIIICSANKKQDNEKAMDIIESIGMSITSSEKALEKLIYITADRRSLMNTLMSSNIHFFEEKLPISFFDLTDASQESIIEAKMIRFQGSFTEQSIKEMLGLREEKFLANKIKDLNLDVIELEMLLKNRKLDLWEKQSTFSDIQSACYKPHMPIKIEQVRGAIEAYPKDIFALEAGENRIKEVLPDEQHELYNFEDTLSTFKPNIHRFIMLDTGKGEEQYKELCYFIDVQITTKELGANESVLHLLKHTGSGWVWMCTYDRNTYLQRNFYPILVGQQTLKELLLNPSSYGFKIVSGMNEANLLKLLGIKKKKEVSLVEETCLIIPDDNPDLEFLFRRIRERFVEHGNGSITGSISENLTCQQDVDSLTVKFDIVLSDIGKEKEIPATEDKLSKIDSLFEKILKCNFHFKPPEKSIHWFKACTHDCNSEKFHWHRSEGNVSKIRKVIEKNATHLLSEVDLSNSKQQIILLAGEPGTGKSFTLARVAEAIKKEKPASLVLKMELKRYKDLLTSKYWTTFSDVLDFLSFFDRKTKNYTPFFVLAEASKTIKTLERKLLSYLLNNTEGVTLLFDGLDELTPREQNCALALFQTIKMETKATMWITTRRHDHANIERELSVLSYTFEPWNRNLQIAVLTKFWDTSLKFSNDRSSEDSFRIILEKRAREILECFQSKLGKAENISNPLIMHMLAEMCLEKINNSENKICTNYFFSEKCFSTEDFYLGFANKKYDIYLNEKLNVGNSLDPESVAILKREYTKAHGRLAVKAIFHDSGNYFHSKKRMLSIDTLLKIGLIEGNENAVNFIHHTFAEYFATDRITHKLKYAPVFSAITIQLWSLLLNNILMSKIGRRFFDAKLTSDKEIEQLLDQIEHKDEVFKIIGEQSRNVYSVLWYFAVDNLEKSFNFFLKSAKSFDSLKEISVHLFEDDTLANEVSYMLFIKCILKYGKELDADRLVELIFTEKYNILYRSVVANNLECVDMIISNINDSGKIVEIVEWSTSYNFGETALHIAFQNSNKDIVEKCIEKLNPSQRKKLLNMRDFFNDLPLDKERNEVDIHYKECIMFDMSYFKLLKKSRSVNFQGLLKYVKQEDLDVSLKRLYFDLFLPAFEANITSRRGAIITRLFSQFLFLINSESVKAMIKFIENFYVNSLKLSPSKTRSKEHISLVNVLAKLVGELDLADNSLPSKFLIHREYKDLDDLRRYISEEIGDSVDFAIHLGVVDHVLAFHRINQKYIYFDSEVCIVFGFIHIDDAFKFIKKAIKLSSYKMEERGFLVEHFNTDMANAQVKEKACRNYQEYLSCMENVLI